MKVEDGVAKFAIFLIEQGQVKNAIKIIAICYHLIVLCFLYEYPSWEFYLLCCLNQVLQGAIGYLLNQTTKDINLKYFGPCRSLFFTLLCPL